ncbi:MAG: BamA/TamA family outer membrane protein [Ignavibacteriales bacterium]|nr:BamA/TamA family outer membrane protein [Ignavibacteriales bacterium]
MSEAKNLILNFTLRLFTTFRVTLLLLSLINSFLYTQTISKIEISGAKIFSENNYLSWINIPPGQKYFKGIEDSVRIRIASALNKRGYYSFSFNNISTEKIDSLKTLLRINITEGTPTLINKIHISSSAKDSVIVNNILSQLEKEIFTRTNIESVFSEIIDHYENKGFPFASVKIESVEFIRDSTSDNHFVNFYLSMDVGTKSTIDKIEIAGNDKTKDYVITRAAQIRIGEEYSQKNIDAVPEKLNRLRFFEPVESPAFYFSSKKEGVLKISIKEKQTNFFDGIAGYVPATNDKESGYLTGFVNVNMRNLFGTGRAASFRWQQENRFSQELELRYLEPWLFGFPFNLEGGLFQRKQDSTYVQRNFDGRLEFLATSEISASVLVAVQSTIPTQQNANTFTVFNSSAFTSGVNLRIDSRDDFYSPTEGIFFNNTYSYTSKKINGPVDFITPTTTTKVTLQRLEFDFVFFKQFFSRQVAALGVHGRELRGDDVELSDLYFLGGTNSLRGYREKQFQGNRILWSNLEYRLLLTRRSFAFLFFDSGYFLRNEDKQKSIPENSSFKIGYGFGLNIETGLGVLSVSFALAKGDSFGEGKIHFGIINEF